MQIKNLKMLKKNTKNLKKIFILIHQQEWKEEWKVMILMLVVDMQML